MSEEGLFEGFSEEEQEKYALREGPVSSLFQTNAGKLFPSFYIFYSGMILLASVAILAVLIFHRFVHRFHLAEEK